MLVYAREPAAERLVAFIASFVCQHSEASNEDGQNSLKCLKKELRGRFVKFLCGTCLNVSDKSVRFRACHIFASMLEKRDELEDSNILIKCLLQRANDKLPRIRAAAVEALKYLQDPINPQEDSVSQQLLVLMASDSSSLVRKACMGALALTSFSVLEILQRLRDTKEDVRRAAYKAIARPGGIQHMDLASRMHVLYCGQAERVESVRRVFHEQLLWKSWFRDVCHSSALKFLMLFDLETHTNAVSAAMQCVSNLDPDAIYESAAGEVDLDSLDFRAAMLMHSLCAQQTRQAQLFRNYIIQSVSSYTCAVNYYKNDVSVCCLLLSLVSSQDGFGLDVRADEHGCKEFVELLRTEFLLNPFCHMALLPDVVRAVRFLMQGEFGATDALLLECAVAHIETDAHTPQDPLRALMIVHATLSTMQNAERTFAALIEPLVERVILPTLKVSDTQSRSLAIQCVALVCLQDRSLVQTVKFAPLFMKVLQHDHLDIQTEALRILVDLLVFVRLQSPSFDEEQVAHLNLSHCASELESAIMKPIMLVQTQETCTDVSSGMVAAAVQGICKLVLSGALSADRDLLVLLLTLYHAQDGDEDHFSSAGNLMRQTLSIFLPAYSFASVANRLVIEDAFIQVLQKILDSLNAREGAARAWRAAQYMAFLMGERPQSACRDPGNQHEHATTDSVHSKLAETVLIRIAALTDCPDSVVLARILLRSLSSLNVSALELELDRRAEILRLLESCETGLSDDKRAMSFLRAFSNKVKDIQVLAAHEELMIEKKLVAAGGAGSFGENIMPKALSEMLASVKL